MATFKYKKLLKNKFTMSIVKFLKYGAILLIIPPIINYAALNRESSILATHGLPYDIGMGQKLFLSCKGSGVPTVIMESPIGLNSDFWLPFQEKLAEITKVCVYDRAGLGLSERANEPIGNKTDSQKGQGQTSTIERMAEDLRKLISSASDQERPLMFVSSEFGTMLARFYTQLYEDNISHLVLINPFVENLFSLDNGIWKTFWYETLIPKWYSYAIGSAVGLNRFLLMANLIETQMSLNDLTTEAISNRQKHLMCSPKHLFSMVDELVNLNESLSQMKLLWSIKQFPQNVSITILESKNDDLFMTPSLFENQKPQLVDKLKTIWHESIGHLEKIVHPNSVKIDTTESIYKQIYKPENKSNHLFNIITNLITKWRKANPLNKKA